MEEPDVQTQNTDPVCWLLLMLKLLSSAASEDVPLLYTEASLASSTDCIVSLCTNMSTHPKLPLAMMLRA